MGIPTETIPYLDDCRKDELIAALWRMAERLQSEKGNCCPHLHSIQIWDCTYEPETDSCGGEGTLCWCMWALGRYYPQDETREQ